MTDAPAATDGDLAPESGGGAPFDLAFFVTVFPEHVRQVCPNESGRKVAVLLHLTDGTVLDLCHVAVASNRWIAAAVFRNGGCDSMDMVFVPFETIQRITVSEKEASDRHLGFAADRTPILVGS